MKTTIYLIAFLFTSRIFSGCDSRLPIQPAEATTFKSLAAVAGTLSAEGLSYTSVVYAGQTDQSGNTNAGRLNSTFNVPEGMVLDAAGNMYITDRNNHCIKKIGTDGTVSTYAGSNSGVSGLANGVGIAARFNHPLKLAIDDQGNLYVADRDNNCVRKIAHSTAQVSILAGSSTGVAGSVDGSSTAARFDFPVDVTAASDGTVYVADAHNHKIRAISAAGTVSTLSGSGIPGWANGSGGAARFHEPSGLALDASGNLIVADRKNACIRYVSTGSGAVSTIAGTPNLPGTLDAMAAKARFNHPYGVDVGADGTVYVAEIGNHCIRAITSDDQVITIAGRNVAGQAVGDFSSFDTPADILAADDGSLYVADIGNHTIRKLSPRERMLNVTLGWEADTLASGLIWYRYANKNHFYLPFADTAGFQQVNVLEVDLEVFALHFAVVPDNDPQKTSDMANAISGSVAAVNGTFFEFKDIGGVNSHSSFLKSQDSIYWHVKTGNTGPYEYLWWKHAGAITYDDAAFPKLGLQIDSAHAAVDPYASLPHPNILSGAPILLNNYVNTSGNGFQDTSAHGYDNYSINHPRTVFLIYPTENKALFLTSDGRTNPYYSFTIPDLTAFIQRYFNPPYAINIDGGGSTTMWIKNQGAPADQGVVNLPSDNAGASNSYDKQRKVLNAIAIRPK